MSDDKASLDDWLLDDQLGQLSKAEAEQLAKALAADPALAARHQSVQRLLEPLDAWTTPPPPGNLAERILAKIAAHDSSALVPTVSPLQTGSQGDFARRSPFSFRELLALAAVVTFFGAILVPGVSHMRMKSQRVACGNNLAGIGRAVSAYASDHSGALPRVRMIPGGKWLRFSDGNGPYSPNSRSPFLLLRFRYVLSPKQFLCPSNRDAVVMKVENAHALADFPDPRNCSYDSLNMGGPTPLLASAPRQPYMADANPLFVNGRFHLVDPETHSPNHHKLGGQNVLFLDGSADWCVSPHYDHRGDNIWQAGSVRIYKGTEVQTSKHDTFLVP